MKENILMKNEQYNKLARKIKTWIKWREKQKYIWMTQKRTVKINKKERTVKTSNIKKSGQHYEGWRDLKTKKTRKNKDVKRI